MSDERQVNTNPQTLAECWANLVVLDREAKTLEREVRAGRGSGPRATYVESGIEITKDALDRIITELDERMGHARTVVSA